MIKIDKTDEISSVDYSWICGDRTSQELINFRGISNAEEFVKNAKTNGGDEYSLKNLARFNIPVYVAGTTNNTLGGHSVLTTLVEHGDIFNFDNFYSWSGYTDEQVLPGNQEMEENSPVSIGGGILFPRTSFWRKSFFKY